MTSLTACTEYVAEDIVPYPNGGRLSYSSVHDLILADRAIDLVWRMVTYQPDGSGMVALNLTHPDLPAYAHIGNPHWSPDGAHFLFQAATYVDHLGNTPGYSTPGLGLACDIYCATYPGGVVTRLTDIVTGAAGVLHPHYNYDGTKVWWSRKQAGRAGRWFVETADIAYPGGVPTLSNRAFHLMLGDGLYETHGPSPDGNFWMLTHSIAGTSTEPGLNLYRCSATDYYTGLVAVEGDNDDPDCWQEHGQFSLGNGWIFYMSSRGSPYDPWSNLQSDVWRISNASPPTGIGIQMTRTIDPLDGTYQSDVPHPVCGDLAPRSTEELLLYVFNGGPTAAEIAGLTTRQGKIVRVRCA